MLLHQQRFPHGSLRLLWELAEQGYEIEFATQGEGIICRLRCGEKESSTVSNNASSALYVAWHNFKQLWGK